jgi:hypothetical protein
MNYNNRERTNSVLSDNRLDQVNNAYQKSSGPKTPKLKELEEETPSKGVSWMSQKPRSSMQEEQPPQNIDWEQQPSQTQESKIAWGQGEQQPPPKQESKIAWGSQAPTTYREPEQNPGIQWTQKQDDEVDEYQQQRITYVNEDEEEPRHQIQPSTNHQKN